jgi:hypothetical protein
MPISHMDAVLYLRAQLPIRCRNFGWRPEQRHRGNARRILTDDLGAAARRGIVRSRTGLVALVIFVLAGAVACTSDSAGRSSAPAAPTTTAADHATHPPSAPVAADASPTQLRARFEQLLGEHALLAMRLTRSQVAKTADFEQVAEASLQHNSDALSQLVETAYDDIQGDRFQQLWQGYVTDLSTYASAAANQDASAKQQARAELMAYCDDYGAWLATASNGQVQPDDATRTARTRVMGLMGQIDAYAARDYSQAYKLARDTYQTTFTAGATLTKASVTPKAAAKLDTPPEQLRSAFAMLLGEHMELIIDAQRATFAGAPEFEAAAAQVNANTATLTKAIGAIVGPTKAAEFEAAWANHVEGLLAYSTAVADKDEAAKETAAQNLSGFGARLAFYFSDIVRNKLPVEALTEVLGVHDKHLIEQINAYAANDYAKAEKLQLEGYQQMLGVANTLVDAIQRTVKSGLPVGGSRTGGGGTAQPSR